MFVENIFIKVNALLTACSLRTRRPRGVPSPDKGRSPSCATEASGNRGLKHTGRGEGRIRQEIPGTSSRASCTQTYRLWQGPRPPGAVFLALPPPVQSLHSRKQPKKPRSCPFSTKERNKGGCALAQKKAPSPVPRVLCGKPITFKTTFPIKL